LPYRFPSDVLRFERLDTVIQALSMISFPRWPFAHTFRPPRHMAIKATIHKAIIQLSDLDRQVYADHALTIARHPSETDERMLIRLLAFTLSAPINSDDGVLELAKDMWDPDEPALWQKDLTGRIAHWIEVGQPDDKRLMRASSIAGRVSVYSFGSNTPIWWEGIRTRITRARNLSVWQIPSEQSQALAELAQRSMDLQVTVQDGTVWVGEGERSVEIAPIRLYGDPESERRSG
jgi:uncharacterized protein YaeQ